VLTGDAVRWHAGNVGAIHLTSGRIASDFTYI
jgi:hypothetical protein